MNLGIYTFDSEDLHFGGLHSEGLENLGPPIWELGTHLKKRYEE